MEIVLHVAITLGVVGIFAALSWMIYKDIKIDSSSHCSDNVEDVKNSICHQIDNLQNEKKNVVSKKKVISYLNHLYKMLDENRK